MGFIKQLITGGGHHPVGYVWDIFGIYNVYPMICLFSGNPLLGESTGNIFFFSGVHEANPKKPKNREHSKHV